MNETEIIQRFFSRRTDDRSIVLGIGDDGAVVSTPTDHELVITTDTMVEDIHFTIKSPPADLGYKLMACNLSDLAAMGATPKWATLNLTLAKIDEDWLQEFSQGLFDCADQFDVSLIGGDLTKGRQINAAIQLVGMAPTGTALTRKGAGEGDLIFVTGTIGLAAQATELLYQCNHDHSCLSLEQRKALYRFTPKVEIGTALRKIATSAIDISDGLLHEVNIICNTNQVGATLIVEDMPITNDIDTHLALNGGEDYELLFTTKPDREQFIQEIAKQADCPITRIGVITSTGKIELRDHGEKLALPKSLGFDHFL